MSIYQKATLVLTTTAMLAACGGQEAKEPALWEKSFAISSPGLNYSVESSAMTLDAYGDLVAVGTVSYDRDPSTTVYDNAFSIYLSKHDADGANIWQSTVEMPEQGGAIYDIESDSNANLYIVGDGFVMKTNRYGEQQWQKTFNDLPLSVTVDGDRVYVPGRTTRIYNTAGELELTIDNGGIYPWQVTLASNGDIVQATWDNITRHTAEGDLIWSVPAPADVTTKARVVLDVYDNVYAAYMGNSDGSGGLVDMELVKVSANGNKQWERTIADKRGTDNFDKFPNVHLHLASTNELLVVSSDNNGRQLTRVNSESGSIVQENIFKGEGRANQSELSADDVLYVAGATNPQSFDGNADSYKNYSMTGNEFSNTLVLSDTVFYVGTTTRVNDEPRLSISAFSK